MGAGMSVSITIALLSPLLLFGPLGNGLVSWVHHPTWYSLFQFFRGAAGNRPLLLIYFVFCAIGLRSAWRRQRDGICLDPFWCGMSTALWAILPPVTTFVVSLLASPVFVDRYLIISLPALVLLAAAGMASLPRSWMRSTVVVLVFLLSSSPLHWWYVESPRSDWRAATAFVLSEAEPENAAICFWYWGHRVFDYYQKRAGDRPTCPASVELAPLKKIGRNTVLKLDTTVLDRLPATYRRVWLILWAGDGERDYPVIMDTLQAHYRCVSEHKFCAIRVLLFSSISP